MEKQYQDSYRSVSILGLIYDTVEKYQTGDSSLKGDQSSLTLAGS